MLGTLELTLLETNKEISQKILNAYAKEINAYLKRAAPKIRLNVQELLGNTLRNTREYEALTMRGELQKSFGLDNPTSRLLSIFEVWLNSVRVDVQKIRVKGKSFFGGLTISMIHADYADVTSLPDAQVFTDKGEVLPWLSWLLEFGDRVIIYEYDVYPKIGTRYTPGSRSGLGVMIKPNHGRWGVPTEFSGTVDKNWVTRALGGITVEQMTKVIQKSL